MEKHFVSRAGEKLQYALEKFNINVAGKICGDFGCSTGGFTDCLLQNGAKKVYAVDTGYGGLEWKIRNDPRVVVMERTNALHVFLPEKADFISVDVGWTPQKLILPQALQNLNEKGNVVSLLKLHYEADKQWLEKGKLKEEYIKETIHKVRFQLTVLGIPISGIVESPIIGKKGGNIEYLIWVKRSLSTFQIFSASG